MPDISVMMKPVSGLCNLNCRYCFYRDEIDNRQTRSFGKMTEDTLRHIISKTLEYSDSECTISYQGGEPTLAGLDFFRKSIEIEKECNRKGIKIRNSIQTNGYVIDSEWADFFAANNFLVGLSIDGPRKIHDANRRDPAGNGTFETVIKASETLKKAGAEFNILSVVTGQTADNIEYIYRFYKKNGFQFLQFIPCIDPLADSPEPRDYSLTPEKYGKFLCRLFDIWYEDYKKHEHLFVMSFENYLGIFLGIPPQACDQRGTCSRQYIVEADGGVYPCDFYVLDGYLLGNVNEIDFGEIDRKRDEIDFIGPSKKLAGECLSCKYRALCRGGCRRLRRFNEAGEGKNVYCDAYKMFFDHCGERLSLVATGLRSTIKR